MELTAIKFQTGNLETEMEKNRDGTYTVSIWTRIDGQLGERVASFRTDEANLTDLINALSFCKDYNFIK